nr:hypothetical protein [Variovorax boronicumulans]
MPDIRKLDPTGERAAATEAMEATPLSGKEHEYRADGDHHPHQDAAAIEGSDTDATGRATSKHDAMPEADAQSEPQISKGIPGKGETPDTGSSSNGVRGRPGG